MQVRNVQLHGGPMHGKMVAVPAGQNHIHIQGMDEKANPWEAPDQEAPLSALMRRGTYSQVSGYPHDFEWDGWDPRERTH
jgi:hypothetical protein